MNVRAMLLALSAFALSISTASAEQPWQRILLPGHLDALQSVDAHIAAAIEALPADAHGLDELPEVKALLAKAQPVGESRDLVGKWRVRSIQVGGLGIFSYPYFKARFAMLGGLLYFEKTTGSQRRSGLLFPDGEHFVFVGGSTVNEDPQRPYSALGGDTEHDSFGKLVRIGKKELLLVLDLTPTHFEVYHLKKR